MVCNFNPNEAHISFEFRQNLKIPNFGVFAAFSQWSDCL